MGLPVPRVGQSAREAHDDRHGLLLRLSLERLGSSVSSRFQEHGI
jgi:hypothetical protein